ncbi:MAG: GTPase Era [Candidatus Aceula meridiana]|nr:GTPase Era [Candidatus Aceula meridiana]
MNKETENKTRCGFISVVGRPNVGKSTLVNGLVGEKIAIVSSIPQTTRNRIRGVYTDERGQIIFIDTPGLVRGKDHMDQCMKQVSFSTVEEVDCVIHLVDANKTFGEEEQMILERLSEIKCPLILGLNKIDLKGKCAHEYINAYQEKLGEKFNNDKRFVILPLSGETENNLDKLIDLVFERLPEGELLYPADTVCDVPQKMAVSDIIREKLLSIVRDEIPYSLAVEVEEMARRRNKLTYISARILVESESQKEIVIGKKGKNLKDVGTLARKELEELLERRVFVDLYVKVSKKWREKTSILQDLGYVG